MNGRQLLLRVGFAVLTVYLALSATFLLVTFAPNTAIEGQVASASFFSGGELNESELAALRQTYREARGLDRPIHVRYVGWLVDMTTLQWGVSYSIDAPVTTLVADRLERTLGYAVPGFLLAVVFGMLGGMYSAVRRGSPDELLVRVGAYLSFGAPSFWLAAVATALVAGPTLFGVLGEPPPVFYQRVLPALLVALTLVAGQLSYTRAESLEQVGREYIRLLRAKGLSRTEIAVRVGRNAAVPLLTLFFTDVLAIFVVVVYVVEFALGIPGFGELTFHAARERDMPLLLGTALVVVFAGVLSNLFQDVVYGVLDPRTLEGER